MIKTSLISTLMIALLFLTLSCKKKEESDDSSPSESCASSPTLSATNKIPLLVVRVQYSNATFQSSASTWSTKIFSADEGNLNHYLNETTYGKYQFSVASESEGCSNDGIVTVTMSEAHPNTQKNSYACYAEKAIRETDASVNYASFDTNGNSKLDQHELQIMFLVAGGESASGINSPGGIWAMATSMYCDKD